MEPELGNGWERWRGTTDARLLGHDRELQDLNEWRHEHMDHAQKTETAMSNRITALETRVAVFAAGGSLVAWAALKAIDFVLNVLRHA